MRKWLQKEQDVWANEIKEQRERHASMSEEEVWNEEVKDMRGEDPKTISIIYKNSLALPEKISLEDAEASMYLVGHQYRNVWLDAYQNKFDPYLRFWITIEAYDSASYKSIPKRTIISLKKIRPDDYLKDLASEFSDIDPITVYRGGNETEREANNSFSWTTDPITAIWFYNRKRKTYNDTLEGEEPKLWTGQIFKKDIIATDNQRSENEIIQHGSIKNLHKVVLTDAELKSALHAEAKRRKTE